MIMNRKKYFWYGTILSLLQQFEVQDLLRQIHLYQVMPSWSPSIIFKSLSNVLVQFSNETRWCLCHIDTLLYSGGVDPEPLAVVMAIDFSVE